MITTRNGHFVLKKDDTPVFLRGAVKSDWPMIELIEIKTYDDVWDKEWEMHRELVRVAIVRKKVVGFYLVEETKGVARILKFAVLPDLQNQGIGTILLHDLEIYHRNAKMIQTVVREYHTSAPFLLKKCGYQCIKTLDAAIKVPGMWENCDGYVFTKVPVRVD